MLRRVPLTTPTVRLSARVGSARAIELARTTVAAASAAAGFAVIGGSIAFAALLRGRPPIRYEHDHYWCDLPPTAFPEMDSVVVRAVILIVGTHVGLALSRPGRIALRAKTWPRPSNLWRRTGEPSP